jgi:hypothetical protein
MTDLAEPLPQPKAVVPIANAMASLPKGKKNMEFITHPAPVCVEMGPFGSGKTTSLFLKKLLCSVRIPRSPLDGVRYAKTGIVRDTYRNLELNTIPSWEERFPRDMGEWRGGGNGEPARARLRFLLQDGSELDWQVEFMAIGDHNVKEFCDGLQWTNAAIDGADAMPPDLLQTYLPLRVGRFPPPKHRPLDWQDYVAEACKVSGVMNAPDMDNYTYMDFIEKPRSGWKLVVQPGGMEPDAENIENLPRGYYENTVKSMNEWEANRFIHNKFGYSRSGKPIYPEYNDELHIAKTEIQFDPARTLHVGIDGGRDCCAAFGQRGLTGRLDVLDELVPIERQGAKQFGKVFARYLADVFPDARDVVLHPDPATDNPNDTDDDAVWLDIFLAAANMTRKDVEIPFTNAFTARREAVATPLRELEEGKPQFRMNSKCRKLRRGFMSGYRFEVTETRGRETKTADMPLKNDSSHPHDALQYLALGSSGRRALMIGVGNARRRRPGREETDWNPHNV